MTGEPEPLMAAKFSMPMRVSANDWVRPALWRSQNAAVDLAFAQEMREHERRMAAMTPRQRAERQARQDAERAAALASAVADWQVVCDRLAGNGPALAALKIHRPADSGSFAGVVCAQREGGDDPDEWPCETFTAIKEA